jgi:hypothetical protein
VGTAEGVKEQSKTFAKWVGIPANVAVLTQAVSSQAESGILFSFDADFYRRVKARDPIRTLAGRWKGRAFTPALILFIVLPESEDKTDPG